MNNSIFDNSNNSITLVFSNTDVNLNEGGVNDEDDDEDDDVDDDVESGVNGEGGIDDGDSNNSLLNIVEVYNFSHLYNNFNLHRNTIQRRNLLNHNIMVSDMMINNFIDSTLNNSKNVYKKVASEIGFSQIEEIQYSYNSNITETSCPIYCTSFTESEIICKLPCSHIFSKNGIYKWLKTSNLCPICRYELDSIEIRDDNSNNIIENQDMREMQQIEETSNNYNNNNYSPFNFITILLQQEQLEYQQAILRSLREN